DIAGANASFVSGRADKGREDDRLVIAALYRHTYAVILALLLLAEKRVLARIKKIRVRIEYAQHSRDGAVVNGLVDVDGIGIIPLDDREDSRETLHGVLHIRSAGRCGSDGRPEPSAEQS